MRTPATLVRPIAVLVAVALSAAACTGAREGGYAEADAVLAAIGQEQTEFSDDAAPAGCERTVTVDEYGFESETFVCPDGGGGDRVALLQGPDDLPVDLFDQLVDELDAGPDTAPDDSARGDEIVGSLQSIGELLDSVDEACGNDFDAWLDGMIDLTVASWDLTETLDGADETRADETGADETGADARAIDGFVGSLTASLLGRAVVERALLQTGCSRPASATGEGDRNDEVDTDALTQDGRLGNITSAVDAVQDLEQALTAGGERALFPLYTDGNFAWLRTQRQRLDAVIIGTSQAGDAVDLPELHDRLGLRIGNAFLPGTPADLQGAWLREVFRYVDPETVVWFVGPLDLLTTCAVAGRADFTLRLDRLSRLFEPSGWFATADPLTVALGPAGPENDVLGAFASQPAPVAAQIAAHQASYGDALDDGAICSDRMAAIGTEARALAATGRRVVIAGMPVSPLFVELVPGGMDTVRDTFTTLADDHLDIDGVTVLDLVATMQDDLAHWRDLTHMTAPGAEAFAAIVEDAWRDAGLPTGPSPTTSEESGG